MALVAVFFGVGEAAAKASSWWRSEHGAVRLIAASNAVGEAATVRLGLHFRLLSGWKIYWRSPGDAGFPPKPDWAGSRNLAEARIDWPAPERFSVLGLETLGYKGEVVLPVTVETFEPGKSLRVRTVVPYLTCSEICVPYEAKLALDMPAGPEFSSREEALIDRFAARVPSRDGGAGLRIEGAEFAVHASRQTLQVSIAADAGLVAPDVYIEGLPEFGFARPRVRMRDGAKAATLLVAVTSPKGKTAGLAGEAVTLTVVDGARAVERTLTPTVAAFPTALAAESESVLTLVTILGLALLGGLILNLMPCVLPVLSLKLLSVVGHGGGAARPVRIGFLASAAGIVAAFVVLGTTAIALKAAGLVAGWGIQFQQPLFLAAMVLVLVLFAGNLWGLFEFRLPGAVADAAAQASGGHGVWGHFATGAFATLLATPCSAPFLGTAVGFALARGAGEIYAVFVALGVGLALPYLAVAAMPTLATRLPRPGPWMVTFRRVLAAALAATALWLVLVLSTQTGFAAAVLVGLLMIAVLVALWQVRGLTGRARHASWAVIGALGVLSLAVSSAMSINPAGERTADRRDGATAMAAAGDGPWRAFAPGRIATEVVQGRVVFVDVTADWCITCKVNKAVVLDGGAVARRLSAPGVTAMQADWTRPDRRISDYLASFGRYGIPFDAVYGPGAPRGIALPEILTEASVLAALERAAGGRSIAGW